MSGDRLAEIEQGLKGRWGRSWEDSGYFLTSQGEFGPGSHADWMVAEIKKVREERDLAERDAEAMARQLHKDATVGPKGEAPAPPEGGVLPVPYPRDEGPSLLDQVWDRDFKGKGA